jgi:RHS repeat-associated protein
MIKLALFALVVVFEFVSFPGAAIESAAVIPVDDQDVAPAEISPAHPTTVQPLNLERPPTTTELMSAGQLGGPLFPTSEPVDKARYRAERWEFGRAIEEWNKHEYVRAVRMFRRFLADFPESPWAAEASLHIGCDATYNGRYSEAGAIFNELIGGNRALSHPGAKMMAAKARQRLALLKVEENDLPAAGLLFQELLRESPDWRHRTYASHWIQRLSRFTAAQQALLSCGAEALAYLLEKEGRAAAAAEARTNVPATMRGHTLSDLVDLASRHGYQLAATELATADAARLPLPAILHIEAKQPGESGHYWVLDKVSGERVELYDPQSRRRFQQTPAELAREWSGRALVFSRGGPVPGRRLELREMESFSGGCCGAPRKEDNLGRPKRNGRKGRKDPCSNGAPVWSVNMVSLNLYVTDTPLWYDPPIGPPIEITLSYNSQSAIAQHEPFGAKWQFNYGSYLVVDTSGAVMIFLPDGGRDVYMPDGGGGYLRPYRVFNTLTKLGANHFELRWPDDTVYVYQIPAGTASQQPFLTAIRDATGRQIAFGYDAKVNLTTVTDAQGRVFRLSYNARNLVTAVNDPFGRKARFEYDAAGRLTRITDMGGYSTSLDYDANVYLSALSDDRGTTSFRVEAADGVVANSDAYPPPGDFMWANYRITVTDPLGSKEEFFYYGGCDIDGFGGCGGYSWHVSPRDYVPYLDKQLNTYKARAPKTRYLIARTNFGRQGEIQRMVLPEGDSVAYAYDPATGDRASVTDGHGHTYRYTYNWLGKITSITDPRNRVTAFGFAPNGFDLVSISDSLGRVAMTYDSQHHLTSLTDRLNNATYLTYNGFGQITSLRNAAGATNIYRYNSDQQLVAITRAGQLLRGFAYDAVGRVSTLTNASGLVLTYEYNDLNEVTRITYPDGKSEFHTYSTCCPHLVDSVTDRSGRTARFAYDPLRRLVEVRDTQGGVIRAAYDLNGNLVGLTDANGSTTSFLFDLDNRLVGKSYPDGTSVGYGYDSAGLMTSRTNASGTVVTYSHDANHNLKGITYSDGTPAVSYTYDSHNRVARVEDGLGATVFSRDANSRLTSIDGPWPDDTLTLGYDALDRIVNLSPQAGLAVAYTFDEWDRPAAARVGTGAYRWSYAGASPLVQALTRPNGGYTTNVYDRLNRSTLVSNRRSDGGVLAEFAYLFNDQGHCISETLSNSPPAPFSQASQVIYRYGNANQLTSTTPPERLFAADRDGNLARGYTPEGYVFSAAYDAENRLQSISFTNSAQTVFRTEFAYRYNHFLGRRRDYVNGALANETRYVRFGSLALQERDGGNQVVREYVWRGAREGGVGELLQVRQGGRDYQYLFDARGNVAGLVDSSQTVAASYDYTPFGVPLARTGALNQPVRFSTKAYDEGTGLLYYGYRFYSPWLGRWLTRDPLGERPGANLYQFVSCNPIAHLDPLGLWEAKLEGYAGVGGAVTVGQNPDGSWYVGLKGGFGIGGGVSFDPGGSMPGYRPGKSKCGPQVSIGFFGDAGAGIGPLAVEAQFKEGVNIAGNSDTLIDLEGYSSGGEPGTELSPKPGFELEAGVSYGLETHISF